jgi:hypothetical protein
MLGREIGHCGAPEAMGEGVVSCGMTAQRSAGLSGRATDGEAAVCQH